MSECEIFLNRLKGEQFIYTEIAEKLGMGSDYASIKEYLCNISLPIEIRLFVSDEDVCNAEIDSIIECFRSSAEKNSNIALEVIEDEFLNLIQENRITSETKPRSLVHRDGDLHPTVHVWIVKRIDMGIYVLLQKRAASKEIHPCCYDVSSAGHVSQGGEFRDAAVRELYEELGLKVLPEKLEFIGIRKSSSCNDNDKIKDNEMSAVYLYHENVDTDKLVLQKSEVEEVGWAEIDELLSIMNRDSFMHCIDVEELQMIKKTIF